MNRFAPVLVAVALTLGACATRAPSGVPAPPTDVAVAVQCKPKLGAAPKLPDTDAAIADATNIFDLAKMYRAGRELRDAWIAKLNAALQACAGAADDAK